MDWQMLRPHNEIKLPISGNTKDLSNDRTIAGTASIPKEQFRRGVNYYIPFQQTEGALNH